MPGGAERILRRRIGSVGNTKKITRAMELIAATRVVRAQQLEQLGFAIGAGPLEGGPDPGPADLDPTVLGRDGHEPAAADGPARGLVDGRERYFDPAGRVGQGLLQPGA